MPKVLTNKEEIIRKATYVFLRNGYYNSSLLGLANACGIEKSHFYYYFKDKKDLMNQCLTAFSKTIEKNVFDVSSDESLTTLERAEKMFAYVWNLHIDNEHGCLLGNTLLETVGKETYFEETIRDFFEKWKNSLSHLYASGKFSLTAQEMALEDIEKIQGSIMLMRLYKNKLLLKNTIDQILERFK